MVNQHNIAQDERNVVRDPPVGSQGEFDFQSVNDVAIAILEHDPRLNHLRFRLVPKKYAQPLKLSQSFREVILKLQ